MSAIHHIEGRNAEDGMWYWVTKDALGGMIEQSASGIEDWPTLVITMAEQYPGVPVYEVQ